MTTDLRSAFPTRPLRVLKHGAAASWVNYLAGLAFLAAAAGVVYWQGPTLLADNEIRQNMVVVPDGTVRNGKCTTRKFIFTDCSADIAYTVAGKRYTARPDIIFIDINTGGYRTGVVRHATKPELATMSIAIDYFWDRVATTLGFASLFAGLGILGFVTGARNDRVRKSVSADPVPLAPVPVELTAANKNWFGTQTFTFKLPLAGKVRSLTSRFAKGEAPFASQDGTCWAVIPQGRNTAVLLDEGLQRVELTDDERQRIVRAAYPNAAAAA